MLFFFLWNIINLLYLLKGEKMKENVVFSAKLYLKQIIATVVCFFVVLSMDVLSLVMFSTETGYVAYGVKEDSSQQEYLYTYEKSSGEDTKKAEYEDKGYTIKTSATRKINKNGMIFFYTVSQIFGLLIIISFTYSPLWNLGIKDNNAVKFGRKAEDKLRGLKIGFMTGTPYFVFCIVMLVLKFIPSVNVPTGLIGFVNAPFYSLIMLLFTQKTLAASSVFSILGLLLIGFIMPIFSHIAYSIGYKDISLSDKLLYKKKKEK